jgi:hypothetical protein
MDRQFTLYWLTGDREVIQGSTIESAFTSAGYSAGASRALDFYAHGDNHEYTWDKDKVTWVEKT